MMTLFIVGLGAASAGATLGLGVALGCMLGEGKRRDLQRAYNGLSGRVRQFVRSHPVGRGIIPTSQEELLALKRVLSDSDEVVLPRWRADVRRGAMPRADKCSW